MLEVRKQHPVFGTGTFEVISADNPSVLAYIRAVPPEEESDDGEGDGGGSAPGDDAAQGLDDGFGVGADRTADTVLCVCNLSRLAQPAELPLQRWEGKVPIELLGRVPFPRIGELPYFVTLAPYGFYWFELSDFQGGP
jgi:maltose alpha-D-glucosyltransferase/alpha-amylase